MGITILVQINACLQDEGNLLQAQPGELSYQGLGNGLGADPFLASVKPHYTCGVNFASSNAKTHNATITLDKSSGEELFAFPLLVQVEQYQHFKEDVGRKAEYGDASLPSIEDILDGLYLIEIRHNDYTSFASLYPEYDVEANVNMTITSMKTSLKTLHESGAIHIIVMNLLPMGCAPSILGAQNPPFEEKDEYGCFYPMNDVVDFHNRRLEGLLQDLSIEFPLANWSLFDINSIFTDAIQHPEHYSCCGAGGGELNFDWNILCGQSGYINGTLTRAWRCDDPSSYIFWDSLHSAESFAEVIANGFLIGRYVTTF
ncbi:hypothetical protein KP509_1Z088000 [Ceratopteris richardii]|nr:hypothetical protein KP509_1Z088000 [Ceratopteris richardii]